MKFKTIKNIPNYKIGNIVNTKDNLGFHPELFPDIFEKIIITDIITQDGFKVEKYDEIYRLKEDFTIVKCYADENNVIFKYYEKAVEYITSKIYLEIEDEIIQGENIELYGVCCKSNWQEYNTTSLELFQKKSKNSKQSESWKYFTSDEKRKNYIKWNRPMYSLNDINKGEYIMC